MNHSLRKIAVVVLGLLLLASAPLLLAPVAVATTLSIGALDGADRALEAPPQSDETGTVPPGQGASVMRTAMTAPAAQVASTPVEAPTSGSLHVLVVWLVAGLTASGFVLRRSIVAKRLGR
jgi:hypothetical protein